MRRFRFDRFELDERSGDLLDRGEPIHLQPKPFALLMLLLENPGVLFSREALLEHLWPGVHVTEDSLSQAIARLRRALGDSQVLQTVQRRGYRLVAEVEVLQTDGTPQMASPAPPPARVLPRPRLQAPPRAGSLLGREAELEQLARDLQERGEAWLYGPPGVGRTALALTAAAQWSREVQGSLQRAGHETLACTVRAEGGLLRAMQRALRISSSEDLEDQRLGVGQALSVRGELLVVVDDAHLDPGALALVQQWQRMAPHSLWLVTSRERIAQGHGLTLRPLPLQPAVRLLSERAGVELEEQDLGVAELVRRLDGLPLALVLAAPRLRLLSPTALLERLSGRFELLRDAGQSLSAALGSAWAELGDEEREALQALAALGTELPLELAEAMLGGGSQALEHLQTLVDASWIGVRQQDGSSAVYLLHNQRAWIEAHSDPALHQQAVTQAGRWLEEHGLPWAERAGQGDRAAVSWLIRAADALTTTVMKIPEDRSPHVLVRMALMANDLRGGRVEDLEALLHRALAHPAVVPAERAGLQLRLGMVLLRRSPVQALSALRTAVDQAEAHGDLKLRSWAWTELAGATSEIERQEAPPLAEHAEVLARQTGDLEYISYARYMRCSIDRINGRPTRAAIEEALALPLASEHNTRMLLISLHAMVLHEQGWLIEAEALFRQRIALARDGQRSTHQGHLAHLLAHAGELEEAEALCEEALRQSRWMGQPRRSNLLVVQLARIQIARGRTLTRVEQELSDLLSTEQPLKMRGDVRAMQALLAARQGRAELAVHRMEGALQDRPDNATMMAMAAILCVRAGDLPQADLWLSRAVDMPDRWPNDAPAIELAAAWLLWARSGEDPQAMLLYEQQLRILEMEPARGCAPYTKRLMEMTWLRPDRQVA
jgi:DNA-binding winged helix-turn-helix (wHTH) protein/tetratricopeptide (TPR) repeat protein